MLRSLKQLLDRLAPPPAGADAQADEHALQLAVAVMLVEVMRADASFHAGERDAVRAALAEKFNLDADEAARLAALGEHAAHRATDLFAFTSRIDARFSPAQKLRMVELMWRVAYADGHLAAHERHVLWRIVDLLHVPHADSMHARQRAAAEAGAG